MNLLDETRNMEQEHTAVNESNSGSLEKPVNISVCGFCFV